MSTLDPIRLDLPTGAYLTLRVLTVGENEAIDACVFEDAAPRQLALQILRHQLVEVPPEFQLEQLDDATLAQLVSSWLHESDPEAWSSAAEIDLRTLERRLRHHYQGERERLHAITNGLIDYESLSRIGDMQASVERAVAPLGSSMAAIQSALAPMQQIAASMAALQDAVAPAQRVASILSQLQDFTGAFKYMNTFASQIAQTFSSVSVLIPDLSQFSTSYARGIVGTSHDLLVRFHAAQERTTTTLEAHQMSFVGGILPISVVMNLSRLKEPQRAQSVIARLGAWLRSRDFHEELMESLQAYPRSRRRVEIIRDALEAHTERKYSLSVPVFIAQAEGMLTDFLAQSQLVRLIGPRVYATIPGTRTFKLNTRMARRLN